MAMTFVSSVILIPLSKTAMKYPLFRQSPEDDHVTTASTGRGIPTATTTSSPFRVVFNRQHSSTGNDQNNARMLSARSCFRQIGGLQSWRLSQRSPGALHDRR